MLLVLGSISPFLSVTHGVTTPITSPAPVSYLAPTAKSGLPLVPYALKISDSTASPNPTNPEA